MTNQKPHIVRPQEENLISNVKKAIAQPNDFPVMFYVWGIGGVGKSTLLDRLQENLDGHFKEISQKIDFTKFSFSAVDETPLGVMEKLHRELPPLGILRKDLLGKSDPFADTLKRYKSTLNDLETKPIDDKKTVEKEHIDQVKQLSKLIANAGMLAGQTALSAGMTTPISLLANSTTSAIVNNAVDATIDGVTMALSLKDNLLLKHQATKQSQELRDLMLEPLPKLTQAFVESLVRHAKHIPVALILDTYEKASADVDTWLRQFLLANKALKDSKVRLVVAGRYHLFRKEGWKELISRSKLVQEFSLKEFEDKQTKSYLEQIGFSDKREVDKLWKTTKGLPFHLDLIRQEKQDEEPINFTEEISDRLLKGLTEQQKRLVQLAACCRWFDRSLLECLVHCQDLEFATGVDMHRNCFEWLKGFDIVEPVKDNDGKYCLKDVARDVIRKSLFNDNRIKFRGIHSFLQKYFEDEANCEVPQESCESEKYTNPDWSQYTAEAIYHAFFNLSREDGKRYFLTHFFTSRFFNQFEVVIAPFAAITAEIEISDKNLLPHENRKFLENLERISPYFLVVWFMIISQPVSEIKVNETQLTREEVEGIENIIKIFLRYVDSLPDGLCKYIGLAGKLSRCNDSQKVEIVKQLEIQSKFLKNKVKSEYSSHIFYFVGLIYLSLHKYEEANVSFDESINLRKDIPEVWNNRGIAKANLEKYEEAIADYNEAINLKSDYINVWNNRGIAKNNLRRYEEAISDYDKAIQLNPVFAEALNNRGNSKNLLGKYEEAIADLDEAIKLKSILPEAWNNRGISEANLEKYQDAIVDFDEAIKLKPDYIDAWNNRGLAKADLEKYQEAIADFEKAIRLNPDDNKAFMNAGYVFNLLEKYEFILIRICFNSFLIQIDEKWF